MNENSEKELEKLPEIETEIEEEKEETHISEIEEEISQVEKIPEELEDIIDTDENIEEELEKESKEEFEEDTLSSETSEERLSELETEIIGNDVKEPQIPQEITKEDLEIQLKEPIGKDEKIKISMDFTSAEVGYRYGYFHWKHGWGETESWHPTLMKIKSRL